MWWVTVLENIILVHYWCDLCGAAGEVFHWDALLDLHPQELQKLEDHYNRPHFFEIVEALEHALVVRRNEVNERKVGLGLRLMLFSIYKFRSIGLTETI